MTGINGLDGFEAPVATLPLPGPHPGVDEARRETAAMMVAAIVRGATPEEVLDGAYEHDMTALTHLDRREMLEVVDVLAAAMWPHAAAPPERARPRFVDRVFGGAS